MTYKKFISRHGKVYGPYIYKSRRENGRVITDYVGKAEKERKITFGFLSFVTILTILLIFFLQAFYPTGKVVFDISNISASDASISGQARLILKYGELLPADSIVKITLGKQAKEFPIFELVSAGKTSGDFFVENTLSEGFGEGYGIEGTKKIYPTIYFRLKIERTTGKEPSVSIPEGSQTPQAETTQSSSQASSESSQETQKKASIGIPETPIGLEQPAESKKEQTMSVTGEAIETEFIDGRVSGLKDFSYNLEEGESASIERGSVRNETNSLSDDILALRIENGKAVVSTNLVCEEQGFGEEYVEEETLNLVMDMEDFDLAPEQGTFELEVIFENKTLVYGEKNIVFGAGKGASIGIPEQPIEPEQPQENITMQAEELQEENVTEENVTEKIKPTLGIMAMPTGLEVKINSSQGTNTSVENITCWVKADDADNDNLTYNGFWYKNGEQQFSDWNASFSAGQINYGSNDVAVDSKNDIISVGTIYLSLGDTDLQVLKYYSNGTKMWNQTFGGSMADYGYGVAVDSNDSILAVGYTESFAVDNKDDFLIVKYNSSGSYLWNITFDGGSTETAEDVALFSNEDFVVAGDSFIVKYNSSGNLSWNLTTSSFDISDVKVDYEGNIIITGTNGTAFVTRKYNSSGSQIWNATYSQARYAQAVAIDSQNSVIVTGYTEYNDMASVKYNSSGSYLLNMSYNGTENKDDLSYGVAVDNQNNIYTVGHTDSSGVGGYDILIFKYNSSGFEMWNRTTGQATNDFGYGIAIDDYDSIVVSGCAYDSNFVKKYYGFALSNQTAGAFANISQLDQSLLFAGDVWECEARAFDGQNYTNYLKSNITMLNVPLYCGINITEKVTANYSLYCNDTAINIIANNVELYCGSNDIVGNKTPGSYSIKIDSCNNTIIQNCYIYNFSDGILIANSSNNTISNNFLQGNINSGIIIENSRSNTISYNSVYESIYGLYVNKGVNNSFSNNIFGQNNISGVYWINSSGDSASYNDIYDNEIYGILLDNNLNLDIYYNNISANNLNGVFINYSEKINVYSNQIIGNNNSGISVSGTKNNIYKNILNNNPKNLFFINASNNTIYSNTITNGAYGIYLNNSGNNTIYDNWLNNTINAFDSGVNFWNTTKYLRENIMAGDYIGGNFWSDYPGNDSDKDGIGDTFLPWNSSGNISISGDYLPLVEPFRTVKMISLAVNSADPANTPAGDITCRANATNENNNNISYHGFWYKNAEQIFGGINNVNVTNLSLFMDIEDIASDSQNNIIVTGTNETGFITIKLNSSGSHVWNNTYSLGRYAFGVETDSQDNVIVTGLPSSATYIITAKYNSSGSLLWNQSFDMGTADVGYDIAIGSNDSVIVTGTTYSSAADSYSMLIVKYNSSGSYLWNATNSQANYSRGIAVDSQDNLIIAGTNYFDEILGRQMVIETENHYDAIVAKYYPNGTQIWSKIFHISSYSDYPFGIAVDSFNNILITGHTDAPTSDVLFVAKIDKYGNLVWSKNFDGQYDDTGRSVITDRQDNVLIGGYTDSFSISGSEGILLKYDQNGNQLWYKLYGENTAEYEKWNGIALDVKGDINVAGWINIMKYSGFTLENQLPGQIINISTIPNSQIGNGDIWKCEALAFDGENYSKSKTSNELRLLYPSTSGGRGACISSWTCRSPGDCVNRQAEVICNDVSNCLTSSNLPSGCALTSAGQCKKIIRCEAKENITQTLPEVPELEKITKEACTPVFECGEWGECRVDYNIENLIEEDYVELQGVRTRVCTDTRGCISYPVEFEENCSVTVPVVFNETEWGNESYVFVYDEETGQVVARLKPGSLYLTFTPTSLGYYDYCFDEQKNYDEEGIDCGGSCPACSKEYKDNFFIMKLGLEVFLAFLLIFLGFSVFRQAPKMVGEWKSEVEKRAKYAEYLMPLVRHKAISEAKEKLKRVPERRIQKELEELEILKEEQKNLENRLATEEKIKEKQRKELEREIEKKRFAEEKQKRAELRDRLGMLREKLRKIPAEEIEEIKAIKKELNQLEKRIAEEEKIMEKALEQREKEKEKQLLAEDKKRKIKLKERLWLLRQKQIKFISKDVEELKELRKEVEKITRKTK
jgi:uncharacterized delta-60 repeat protein